MDPPPIALIPALFHFHHAIQPIPLSTINFIISILLLHISDFVFIFISRLLSPIADLNIRFGFFFGRSSHLLTHPTSRPLKYSFLLRMFFCCTYFFRLLVQQYLHFQYFYLHCCQLSFINSSIADKYVQSIAIAFTTMFNYFQIWHYLHYEILLL